MMRNKRLSTVYQHRNWPTVRATKEEKLPTWFFLRLSKRFVLPDVSSFDSRALLLSGKKASIHHTTNSQLNNNRSFKSEIVNKRISNQ